MSVKNSYPIINLRERENFCLEALVESYDSGGIGLDGSSRWMAINELMFLKFEGDQMDNT